MNTKSTAAKPAPEPTKADAFPVPDAATFQQSEPHPEDYPPSAKVTPPALQLNPALATAVGEPSLPKHDPISAPIKDGIEAHADLQSDAHELAQEIAAKKAELRELEARQA